MRDLRVGIGERVRLEAPGFRGDAVVVGRAVLPAVGLYQGSDHTALGEGVIISERAAGSSRGSLVVGLEPGTDRRAYTRRLVEALLPYGQPFVSDRPSRPADVQSLTELRDLPIVQVGVVVAVIAVAVGHSLVLTVRRRRRDLAVMQTLGARRRTLYAAAAWQAVTVAVLASAFGVPLGIIAGRWGWMALASMFATLPVVVVPWTGLALFLGATVTTAAVVGLVPAGLGLRRLPGTVLREEE